MKSGRLLELTVAATMYLVGACTGLSKEAPKDHAPLTDPLSELNWELKTPRMLTGPPAAGQRVRVTPLEYAGTEVYHSLYLPADWKPDGRYPVIVEYTGNYWPPAGSTGEVKDANLGYGLGGPQGFIWVVMPYVEVGQKENAVT